MQLLWDVTLYISPLTRCLFYIASHYILHIFSHLMPILLIVSHYIIHISTHLMSILHTVSHYILHISTHLMSILHVVSHYILHISTYLMSILHMCVSLDLPAPQGSMRNLDARMTARISPRSPPSLCSTEVETRTQAPLGSSVRQDRSAQKSLLGCGAILFRIY